MPMLNFQSNGFWPEFYSTKSYFGAKREGRAPPHHPLSKGFSRPRHLQGKWCKTGLCGQAWSFPLFDPM